MCCSEYHKQEKSRVCNIETIEFNVQIWCKKLYEIADLIMFYLPSELQYDTRNMDGGQIDPIPPIAIVINYEYVSIIYLIAFS